MNEKVSFTKDIDFKTLLYEITSISLEHTLNESEDNRIKGDLVISGTYKQTEASQIENPFSYKLPVDIEIDNKYELSNVEIEIDDFTYEVTKENSLKVNIDILLKNLIVKEEVKDELVKVEDLFLDESEDKKLEIREDIDVNTTEEKETISEEKENINEEEKNTKSLFESIDTSVETYKTYSIYVLKENDSMEDIMNKYKVKRNELEEYNDLNDLKKGKKIIIPGTSE